MEQFIPETVADWIGFTLVMAVLVRLAWGLFIDHCERMPIYDPLVHGPEDQKEIACKHVSQRASSQLIGGLLQLEEEPAPAPSRLVPVRYPINNEATNAMLHRENRAYFIEQEMSVQNQMAADTIKGKRP